jgi:uncharacterized protein (TIGR02118 family)
LVVKLIYCFRKRAELSDEAFDAYCVVHGPLGACIPGLRRLVQSRALRVPNDARPSDFDGVTELWCDDVEALRRARASREWQDAGLDEPNFLDPARTAYLVTEERTILAADAPTRHCNPFVLPR